MKILDTGSVLALLSEMAFYDRLIVQSSVMIEMYYFFMSSMRYFIPSA